MSQGLYEGVAAMAAAEKRLEAVASNLANLGATGYKRRGSATHSFNTVLNGQLQRQLSTQTTQDFTQGALRHSGNTYDLALAGEGFFVVETPSGEAYTRNGQFRIDDEGVLQTHSGFQVAWQGARGIIDPNAEEVRIDAEGNVTQGESRVGQLKLTNFARKTDLRQDQHGLYHAGRGLTQTTHEAVVRQGFSEGANVNAVDEMVSMIAAQRSFESSARLMQMIDQTYRRLTAPR